MDYISREVARRLIDSPRSKEQMLSMLKDIPSADVIDKSLVIKTLREELAKDKEQFPLEETDPEDKAFNIGVWQGVMWSIQAVKEVMEK